MTANHPSVAENRHLSESEILNLTSRTAASWVPASCWAPLWSCWGDGGGGATCHTAGSAHPVEGGWKGCGTFGRWVQESPHSPWWQRSWASLEVKEETALSTCMAASLGRHLLESRGGGVSDMHAQGHDHEKDVPVRWLGSLLKGLGGSAGGCLWSVGGLENVKSMLSAGYSPGFFVGGTWIFLGAKSCWLSDIRPNSTEPEKKPSRYVRRWGNNKGYDCWDSAAYLQRRLLPSSTQILLTLADWSPKLQTARSPFLCPLPPPAKGQRMERCQNQIESETLKKRHGEAVQRSPESTSI